MRQDRQERAADMTIGELATRTGTTAETIRYYERTGVLPHAPRAASGYRRYGAGDVARLGFIRRARELGFPLGTVRELLALSDAPGGAGPPSCAEVDQLARAQLAAIEAKLAQLGALKAELERIITSCAGPGPVAECRILGALSDSSGILCFRAGS